MGSRSSAVFVTADYVDLKSEKLAKFTDNTDYRGVEALIEICSARLMIKIVGTQVDGIPMISLFAVHVLRQCNLPFSINTMIETQKVPENNTAGMIVTLG